MLTTGRGGKIPGWERRMLTIGRRTKCPDGRDACSLQEEEEENARMGEAHKNNNNNNSTTKNVSQ